MGSLLATSRLAPALLLVTALGCGESAPSGAAASATGAPAVSGAKTDAPAAKPASDAEKPADKVAAPSGSYERGSLLAYLPKECAEGRAYVDVQKLFGGDGGAIGSLIEKALLSDAKDKGKAEGVLKALRDGGLEPATTIKEIAACVTTEGAPVLALGADTSKSKDPLGTLFAALESGEGKGKAQLLDDGGFKYVKNPRGEVLGMVAPNVLVLAKNLDRLKEAAKVPGGAAAFEAATSNVVWLRMTGRDKAEVTVKEQGSSYDLLAAFTPAGPAAAQLEKDPKAVLGALEGEAKRRASKLEASPLKALAPVIQGAKFTVEGNLVKIAASIPQATIVETVKVLATMPDEQLFRSLQ